MIGFDNYIDFSEFDEFDLLSENKSTKIATSSKKYQSPKKYIFKIFQFECLSSEYQKIILETFYQISKKKCQYLLSYNHLSFSYSSKFNPTFSMKHISSKTLEHVLKSRDFLTKLGIKNIIQCLFAVSEGMHFLHSHLIYHGNLCPSNIIIDEANQFYLVDFGLYPIKKLYINDVDMFESDYKDPYMKNSKPTFINDVYSFGVLMCDICMVYMKARNKMKENETLHDFLKNKNKDKYNVFPSFFAKLIPSCLNSFVSERPSFTQIINIFKNTKNQKVVDISIQDLFDNFINSSYILNLASKDDSISLNKIGKMYEKGKEFEKNIPKAMEFYEKAAKLGNSNAQNNYGVLLQKNAGKDEFNMVKGAHYLQLSAEQENIFGMANYGIALLNGEGVDKNFQKAEEYLKKSANLGYSFAQLKFGCLLLNNNPSISAINKGLSYIKKAINQQNPDAYYTFGMMLQKGEFVEKNDDLAIEYFKIASDLGNDKAILEYANANVEKHPEIANKYYQIAFDNGNKNAKKKMNELKEKLEEPKIIAKQPNKKNKIPEKTQNKKDLSDESYDESFQYSNDYEESEEKSKVIPKNQKRKQSTPAKNKKYKNRQPKKSQLISKKILDQCSAIKDQLNKNIPAKITKKMDLISLGNIVYDRANYHTFKYIYPVGYQIDREYFSIENPEVYTTYRSSILDGGDSPIFRVECLDASKKVFEGNSPSKPWRDVLFAIKNKKIKQKITIRRNSEISGPTAYGLSIVSIKYLIEQLPNANLCSKYECRITSLPAKKKNKAKRKDNDLYTEYNDYYDYYDDDDKSSEDNDINDEDNDKSDEDDDNINKSDNDEDDDKENKDDDIIDEDDDISDEDDDKSDDDNCKNDEDDDKSDEDDDKSDDNNNKSESSEDDNNKTDDNDERYNDDDDKSDQDSYSSEDSFFNFSTKSLIEKGDDFLEKNDLENALKCFQEVLKNGDKSVLLKCAESSLSFETKIMYFEEAIKAKIPMSFSKWRMAIMKHAYLTKDNKELLDLAKKLEKYNDYTDASILYKKANDILNSQICYHKAKQNIESITDGHQQYNFAILNINHKDFDLAKIMLQKAIKNNISQAESKIKKLNQIKFEKELSEAETLLEKGINYFEGKNGCQKDMNKAMTFFENASKLGCPKADFYIGSSIKNAHGLEYLKKSANSGDPDGQNYYANYLKKGILVKKDMQKAMHYYKLAADQGQEEAMFEFGKDKYENGHTREDKLEGIEYLKKSAEKLFPDAIYMYSKIMAKTNPEESKKIFEFAVEKGSPLALEEQKSIEK